MFAPRRSCPACRISRTPAARKLPLCLRSWLVISDLMPSCRMKPAWLSCRRKTRRERFSTLASPRMTTTRNSKVCFPLFTCAGPRPGAAVDARYRDPHRLGRARRSGDGLELPGARRLFHNLVRDNYRANRLARRLTCISREFITDVQQMHQPGICQPGASTVRSTARSD